MAVAMTDALNFTPKMESPQCVAYRYSTNANAYSYSPTQVVQIDLPCGQGENVFLNPQNSYLKFTLNVTCLIGATSITSGSNQIACQLGSSAMDIFQQLDLFSQSNLIETIQDYNVLTNIMLTYCVSSNARQSQWSAQVGTLPMSQAANINVGGNSNVLGLSGITSYRQGDYFYYYNSTGSNVVSSNVTVSRTFCVPLLGFLGMNNNKYIPCGSLASDMRLELTLANTAVPFYGADTNSTLQTWNISNVQYCGEIIKISPEALAIVHQANPLYPNVMINYTSFRNYTASVASGSSSATLLFGARFASLKSLLAVIRDQSIITGSVSSACNSTSCFTCGPLYQWYFTIGTQLYPPQPVYVSSNSSASNTTCMWYMNGSESLNETLKAFHALNMGWGYASAIDNFCYITNPSCDTNYSGKSAFLIGMELESFSHKPEILSGINTQSQNVFLNLLWSSPINPSYQVDLFAVHDSHVIIQNGVMSARF